MKILLGTIFLALAISVYSLTEEQKAKWKKWSEECQAETGVSQETINKLRNNQFDNADNKIKAHALCFGKKSGLVKANGETDVEQVRTKLAVVVTNQEDVEKIITKCVVTKATPEETAFEVFKCLREQRPKFSPV